MGDSSTQSTSVLLSSTSAPIVLGEVDLEAAGGGGGSSAAGWDGQSAVVYAAAGVLMAAVLIVVAVVSIRRRRRRHIESREGAISPAKDEPEMVWDFGGEPQQFDMDKRMSQLISATEKSPSKAKQARPMSSLINPLRSVRRTEATKTETAPAPALPGGRKSTNVVCHLGEIDHLRVWAEEATDQKRLDDTDDGASKNSLVICDLCEGMGTLAEATHACVECGNISLCAKCHVDTHASETASFKTHTCTQLNLPDRAATVSPTMSPRVVSPTTPTAVPILEKEVPKVTELDRLPFKSEMQPIRSQYLGMRRNPEQRKELTKQYTFYARDDAEVHDSESGDSKPRRATAPASVLSASEGSTAELRALLSPEGTYAVMPDTPLGQIPLDVKRELKDMPTRRQAMDIRRQVAQVSRRQTETCMRTRELLQRRVTDILLDANKAATQGLRSFRSASTLTSIPSQTGSQADSQAEGMSEMDFEGLIVPDNSVVTLSEGDTSTVSGETTSYQAEDAEEVDLNDAHNDIEQSEKDGDNETTVDDELPLLPRDVVAEVLAETSTVLARLPGSVLAAAERKAQAHHLVAGDLTNRGLRLAVDSALTVDRLRADAESKRQPGEVDKTSAEMEDEREEQQRQKVKQRMKRMLNKVGVPTLQRTRTDQTDATGFTGITFNNDDCDEESCMDSFATQSNVWAEEEVSARIMSPEVYSPLSPTISSSVLGMNTVMDELRNALKWRKEE